jgi:hypothetical protein
MFRQIFVIMALVFVAACSQPNPNGNWTFSSDLTRKEADFPKGSEGDKSIAVMASFVPRLKIENNSWMVMRDTIRCTILKLNEDKGIECVHVKDGKMSGSMKLELNGDVLKIKESNKPTYVYVREK